MFLRKTWRCSELEHPGVFNRNIRVFSMLNKQFDGYKTITNSVLNKPTQEIHNYILQKKILCTS